MKALHKDTFKEIWKSKSRFLSIVVIIALGVCFFCGIKATSPSMKYTVNTLFDEQKLMDLHLVSTWGFTQEDVKALREEPGVAAVTPTYSTDVIVEKGDKRLVFKVMALPQEGEQNQPLLMEGRLPTKDGECVMELPSSTTGHGKTAYVLGDTITMNPDQGEGKLSDTLTASEFTIVGFVRSPLYISIERGSTSLGSGDIAYYMMVNPSVFKTERYTDVYLKSTEAQGLDGYSKEYDETVDALAKKVEIVGDTRLKENYDQIMEDGTLAINEGKRDLLDAQNTFDAEIAKAEATIADSEAQLAQGEADLAAGWDTYNEKIAQGEAEITASEEQLAQGEARLSEGQAALTQGQAQYQEGVDTFEKKKIQAESGIALMEGQIHILEMTDPTNAQIPYLKQQVAAVRAELTAGQAKLDESKKTLADNEDRLTASAAELEAGKAKLEEGRAQLEEGRTSGLATLEEAQAQLESGKAQLAEGKAQLESQRAEGQRQLDDAQRKITEAEDALAKVEYGKWYYFDRTNSPGYSSYGEDADRIDHLANVFPLFFLLVAVLVSFTTMTRMVEEQRMEIGTLKGLGYPRSSIAFKYVIYAFLAAGLGAVVGAAVGVNVLPQLIVGAYSLLYQTPALTLSLPWPAIVLSIMGAILFTVGAAEAVSSVELNARPSELMRPKAPKIGKRILLERIGPIWNHMGFISKVTARNIMRYKARFLMTVIGIAGCTALILAGFGLQDSIFSIIPRQFEEISTYDGMMGFKHEGSQSEKAAFRQSLLADANVSQVLIAREQKMSVKEKDGDGSKSLYLFIPENPQEMTDFIHLRHRSDPHTPLTLDDSGAIITEKIAGDLGIEVGDTITVFSNDSAFDIQVSDITENYLEHYLYMTEAAYEKATGKPLTYNAVHFNLKDTSTQAEDDFAAKWLNNGEVATISYTTNIVKTSNDSLASLNIVVVVMLISAGALAFVVLYNLTNINVSERVREIATIRVLGFYDNEVNNYIFRENIVLSLIGMVFGLGLGVLLNHYIITTVETDVVMFGRGIEPTSYLYSCLFTMGFTLVVNFIMRPVIKRVDMVESLKSIE